MVPQGSFSSTHLFGPPTGRAPELGFTTQGGTTIGY
jgi:hypothetical protein